MIPDSMDDAAWSIERRYLLPIDEIEQWKVAHNADGMSYTTKSGPTLNAFDTMQWGLF